MRGRLDRRSVVGLLATAVLVVLVLGWQGLLLAGFAGFAASVQGPRRASRSLAATAAVLLVGAAVATVVEAPLSEVPNLAFALQRPTAGALAALAGSLLLASVAIGWAGAVGLDDDVAPE